MRNALLALLLVSVALSGCTGRSRLVRPPQQTFLSSDRVALPATFVNGLPCVELKVNGAGPYRFLIDTGAEMTCLTPQVARDIRIALSLGSGFKLMGAGGTQRAQIGTVDRFESPGFSLGTVGIAILSPEITAQIGVEGYEINGGIIGMSAFAHVLLEIDFPGQAVSLHRPGSVTHSPETGLPYTGIIPHVYIAMPSSQRPATTVLVDTGAVGGFFFTGVEDYPVRGGLAKADEYYRGIGGFWRPKFGQLAGEIRLGPATWRDPEIRSADKDTLGSGALAPWKLVIDQQRKLLWLLGEKVVAKTTWAEPLEPDGRPAVYGFVGVADGNALLVKEVDPGSRAERAGLKVGDRYLWENVDATTPGTVAGQVPPRLRLHVTRGSEKFAVTLSLLDPLPPPPRKE